MVNKKIITKFVSQRNKITICGQEKIVTKYVTQNRKITILRGKKNYNRDVQY